MLALSVLFVWSKLGFPAATGDPLSLWKAWTQKLSGTEIDCGHFMPEENPEALLCAAVNFLNADNLIMGENHNMIGSYHRVSDFS